MNDVNRELNRLDIYKNNTCVHCGRRYPQTILNIEGVIHHGESYRCLDQKSCKKFKKKKSKKYLKLTKG